MDTATLSGKMLLGFLSLMAACEPALRRARQREGLVAAQAQGVHCGRTKRLTPAQVIERHQVRAAGVRVADLTRRYGMTRTRIYRYLVQGLHAPAQAADEPHARGKGVHDAKTPPL